MPLLAEHVQEIIKLKNLDKDPGIILATLFQSYHEEKEERPKSKFEYGKSRIKTLFGSDDKGAGMKCAEFYADSLTEEKGVPSGKNLFDPVNQFFPETLFNHARESFVRALKGFCVFHPDESAFLSDNIREKLAVVPWQPFDDETLSAWIQDLIQGLAQNKVLSAVIAGGNKREMRENSAHMLGMLRPFLPHTLHQSVFAALKARTTAGWLGKKDSQPAVREAAMTALVTLSPLFSDDLREELPDIFFEALKSGKIANREAAGRVFVQYICLWPEGQRAILEKMIVLFHQEKKTEVRCAAIQVMASICRQTANMLLRTHAFDQIQTGLWEENNPGICRYTAETLQALCNNMSDMEKEPVARKLSGRMFSSDPSIRTMATSAMARMPGFFRKLPEEMLTNNLDLFLGRLLHPMAREDDKAEHDDPEKNANFSLTMLLNTDVDRELQFATVEALKNLADILLPLASGSQQRKWILGLLAACHNTSAGLMHLAPQALLSCPALLKIKEADSRRELQDLIASTMTALVRNGVPDNATAAAAVIGHLFPEADENLQARIVDQLCPLRKTGKTPESRKAATLALMYVWPAAKETFPDILTEILRTVTEDLVLVKEAVLDAMPALLSECSDDCQRAFLMAALAEQMNDADVPWQLRAKIAVCLSDRLDDAVIAPKQFQEAMLILTAALESELDTETRIKILNGVKTLRRLPSQDNLPENDIPKSRLLRAFVGQLENPDVRALVADGIKDWVVAKEEGILAAVFSFLTKKLCTETTPGERVLFADILSTTLEEASEQQTNQYFFRLFDKVARYWLDMQNTQVVAGTGLEVMGLACAKNASRLLSRPALQPEAVQEDKWEPAVQKVC